MVEAFQNKTGPHLREEIIHQKKENKLRHHMIKKSIVVVPENKKSRTRGKSLGFGSILNKGQPTKTLLYANFAMILSTNTSSMSYYVEKVHKVHKKGRG